jgi:hypothetical protein
MRVGRRRVVHWFVVLVVLIQLGFAVAFLVDAAETNRTYDALASHRVAVHGHSVGCVLIVTGRFATNNAQICRVDYSYSGQDFTAVIPYGETTTFLVDPLNTSYRMNEANFEKGPTTTVGDLVFASVAVFGALAVTAVHLEHLREMRSRRSRHGHESTSS